MDYSSLLSKPFIIAEMSGNHNHSIDRAMAIIKAAAEAGASAVKLQTYTPDTITVKGAYTIDDPQSLWYGRDLYDLYAEAYTPWEWHKQLFDYAQSLGIICFSTPFDTSAVDFLESIGNPIYKIASFENTDHVLLNKVAQTGKPVIMSTGIASCEDILESVNLLKNNGINSITLLKCTSEYPAPPEDINLLSIPYLREQYKCPIGLSDHTLGIGVAIASISLSVTVIEKHFTLNRADGGIDSAFSVEPNELKTIVEECNRAWLALGKADCKIGDNEKKSTIFKRSLYVVKDIKAGELLTEENVRSIRPSLGLHTRYYKAIVGKKVANVDIKAGTPLSERLIKDGV